MNYWDRKLMREQMDAKLERMSDPALSEIPDRGWIRLIREALGMSGEELGKRAGMDQSRVSRLEKAEMSGEAKLSSMRKVAEGLGMKLVYGLVPKDSLEGMVREQAEKVARYRMEKASHLMRLEDQELTEGEKERVRENLVHKILIGHPKDLWSV